MIVDLNNFFKYYDDKNPKHSAAIDELEKELLKNNPELLQDSSNWIRIYRTSNNQQSAKELAKFPWYPQTDNYALPDSTCNSSSCAMCLEYLKPGSLPSGPNGDNAYLKKVLAIGKSTDNDIQTRVLLSYGVKSTFRYDLDFDDLDEQLSVGKPLVLGILHRGPTNNPTRNSGHMICCIGKTDKGDWIINDPYGSLKNGYSGPVVEGRRVIYSKLELEKRWTADGPRTGWGRIFE
jgi:hypothetical protein